MGGTPSQASPPEPAANTGRCYHTAQTAAPAVGVPPRWCSLLAGAIGMGMGKAPRRRRAGGALLRWCEGAAPPQRGRAGPHGVCRRRCEGTHRPSQCRCSEGAHRPSLCWRSEGCRAAVFAAGAVRGAQAFTALVAAAMRPARGSTTAKQQQQSGLLVRGAAETAELGGQGVGCDWPKLPSRRKRLRAAFSRSAA